MTAIPGLLGAAGTDSVGITLCRGTTDQTYYSPWSGTQTDAATFGVALIAKNASTHLEVEIETRNEGDATPTVAATISFTTETPPDVKPARGKDLKSQFRYKVTVENASGCATFRFLVPSWERR